jgi:hypothetical protein
MVEIRFKPSDIGTVADGSITEAKLANDAVTSAKIATGAVGNTELAANAVTAEKILDGEVKEIKVEPKKFIKAGPLSGDKIVKAMGYDSTSGEVIIDHDVP